MAFRRGFSRTRRRFGRRTSRWAWDRTTDQTTSMSLSPLNIVGQVIVDPQVFYTDVVDGFLKYGGSRVQAYLTAHVATTVTESTLIARYGVLKTHRESPLPSNFGGAGAASQDRVADWLHIWDSAPLTIGADVTGATVTFLPRPDPFNYQRVRVKRRLELDEVLVLCAQCIALGTSSLAFDSQFELDYFVSNLVRKATPL